MRRNGINTGPFEQNGWAGYQRGFGSAANKGNFWWGLENLHKITSIGKWNVLFMLRNVEGNFALIQFNGFSVGSSSDNYRLSIERKNYQYLGSSDVRLQTYARLVGVLNNEMFTTNDADNDRHSTGNMAKLHGGGFWFGTDTLFLYPPTGKHFHYSLMAISRA